MTRGRLWLVALLLALAPTVALGAGAPGGAVELAHGPVGTLAAKALALARGLFVFSLVTALLVEAFGRAPVEGRDYGGVAFRAGVVLLLLAFYSPVFTRLIGMSQSLAAQVAPAEVWERYTKAQEEWQQALLEDALGTAPSAGRPAAAGGPGQAGQAGQPDRPDLFGGMVFDAALSVALLLGQAAHWVMGMLARILAALLYVVGPLALVFAIPGPSGTGARWFRLFCSVLAWPILSALLLAIAVDVGIDGQATTGFGAAFASLAMAGLMAAIACATPVLAGLLVGAGASFVRSGLTAASGVGSSIASAGGLAKAGREAGGPSTPASPASPSV